MFARLGTDYEIRNQLFFEILAARLLFNIINLFFYVMLRRSRCVLIFLNTLFLFLEKNLNASRPSELPPVREKNVITFRWDSGVLA